MTRDCVLNNMILEFEERENLRKIQRTERLADYLIENASEAFEHQDRELLIEVLKRWDK